jgi:uncharacterized protein
VSKTSVSDSIAVYDCDSHVSEPPDLWTSRVNPKFGDLVPRVVWTEERGHHWIVGDKALFGVGQFAMAGWREFIPGCPPTLADADAAAWQPKARLARMDEYGIHTQVLFPNLVGFFIGAFVEIGEPELMLACVRAYNDFIAEFAGVDSERFVPLMMLPYWDINASIAEMDRCLTLGHRGIVAAGRLDGVGLPPLRSVAWDPLWAAAQERGLSMNFHIGFNAEADPANQEGTPTRARFSESSAQGFMANMRTLAEVICSGLLHRFPRLKVVSVESGAGWIPFFLEALDWQWQNNGAGMDHPERELPSTYFWRQVYATYWFEREDLPATLARMQDNLLFSTDFPHPTSQSPGPASYASNPRDYIDDTLGTVDPVIQRKVLATNACAVYATA